MIHLNMLNGNVVVTRPITQQQQQSSPTYYEDDILTSVYYAPQIPFVNLSNLINAQWFFTIAQVLVITALILFSVLIYFLFKKTKHQYKCPNCGESFCFENMTPENCKTCGHPLIKVK
ncbi:MAG: hypothetical protein E7Z87_01685 [Cyanobacteria bacterium SIG26]|nr:hypothetical protein [Cyanobacteria bacterium SIG26]